MALTDNLVSYWKMDGNSNDSVSAFNGTDTAITYSSGNGKIIQGAGFNGTTSKISLPNLGVSGSSARSVSAWVKLTVNSAPIYWSGTAGSDTAFSLNIGASGINAGTPDVSTFNGTGVRSTTTVNDGNWHHVVTTYNGGVMNSTNCLIYVDGALTSSSGGSGVTNNSSDSGYLIGSWPSGFYGSEAIDEVGVWSRALTYTEVKQLYNANRALAYPLTIDKTVGLISYYKMDGNSTDVVSSFNGTDTAITYSAGNGKIVQGGGFNGTTSSILLPNNDWKIESGFTVGGWVKTSSSLDQIIIGRDTTGTGRMFILRIEGTTAKANFYRFDQSTTLVTNIVSPSAYNDGNWHHIMGVFDSTIGSKIYVDGVQVISDSSTSLNRSTTASAPYIGVYGTASISYFNGSIDEIGIWNVPLSSTQITQLYNSGNGSQYPFTTNITMIADASSFILTGFATNFSVLAGTLIANVGNFILTGYDAILRATGWQNQSKNTSSYSNQSKNSSSWTNQSKN